VTAPRQPAPDSQIKIGLWGSPGSGKTTYIGALRVAAEQAARRPNATWNWAVIPSSESADQFSARAGVLVNDHRFPQGTTAIDPISWTLVGGARGRGGARIVRFGLDLLDAPGRFVADGAWGMPVEQEEQDPLDFDGLSGNLTTEQIHPVEALVTHLADCDGIIYLLDPIRSDEGGGDAFRYFNSVLAQIEARNHAAGRLEGSRLPHHLAVCVTKFDDPVVVQTALGTAGIEALRGAPAPVRVPQNAGRKYLTETATQRPDSNTRHVYDAIEARFIPERVSYYPMSAVGFYVNGSGFDPDDFTNVLEGENTRIRGHIYPMNVLEPLIWMVAGIQQARRGRQQ
jgi:hypothetical protein